MAAVHNAGHVGADDPGYFPCVKLPEQAGRIGDAGIVHPDINLAEGFYSSIPEPLHLLKAGDIAVKAGNLVFAEFSSRFFALLLHFGFGKA